MCNIIIIGPSSRFLSGISYFTMRLSNALAEQSPIVYAVLFRRMLPARLFPGWRRVGKGLNSIQFSKKVEQYEIIDWYNPISWFKAASIVRRGDLIILEWWTASVAHMYLAILCMIGIRRKNTVIEFHEVVDPLEQSRGILRIYARIMGRLIRDLSSGYVVHSQADRDIISLQFGIDPSRVRVIPHGIYDQYPIIEQKKAKDLLEINNNYSILFFGLIRPYKGVPTLIEAFESLPDELRSGMHLFIVGEAWEDHASVIRVHQSSCRDQITLIDHYVSDEEISLYFSAADVLVLPYTRASQSGVAHIGMAFGLPIIATRVGGLIESLGKYQGTFFISPGDSRGLADALVDVFRNKGGRYPAPDDIRWDKIAKQWLQLYKETNQ